MKYFVIEDFGTIVECEKRPDIPAKLGYKSRQEMIKNNGCVPPDIYEISEEEYRWQEEYGEYDIA